MRKIPHVISSSYEHCLKPASGISSLIQTSRFAIIPLVVLLIAGTARADKISATNFDLNRIKKPFSEQVEKDQQKIPDAVLLQLSRPEFAKGIDWDKLQESLNLADSVLDELISEKGSPSLFKIGDELIVNAPLGPDSRRRLAELIDKYKITNAGKIKTLLAKDELTSEDYVLSKFAVIEIIKAQRKIILLSKKERERLKKMSASALKNADAANLSSTDLILFGKWCSDLEEIIKESEELIETLNEFEQDLR
jgi:hypothetical protein